MDNFTSYKWLDEQGDLAKEENQNDIFDFLEILDKKDILPGKKNVLACYYIDQISKENNKSVKKLSQKDYQSWYKSASFKKVKERIIKNDMDKSVLSAIVSMMMATLVLYFIGAILQQSFVISFSIDAIIGCLAFILLIRNLRIRYRIIKRYTYSKDIYYLDVCSLILCILFKLILPYGIDLSLIILLVDYYITKRKLEKILEIFNKDFKV